MRSSYCTTETCVQIEITPVAVWVKDEHDNQCEFDHNEWRAFLLGVKNGEFDVPE